MAAALMASVHRPGSAGWVIILLLMRFDVV
jgi:hypothetical protein